MHPFVIRAQPNPAPERQLAPRVLQRVTPSLEALENGPPWRWKWGGWGLIYSRLVGGERREWCGCSVWSAPVLSFGSILNPPFLALLIRSTLHTGKRDSGAKVGHLHSLSQEEEAPWCKFTCAFARWRCHYEPLHSWRTAERGCQIRERRGSRVALPAPVTVEWPSEARRAEGNKIPRRFLWNIASVCSSSWNNSEASFTHKHLSSKTAQSITNLIKK